MAIPIASGQIIQDIEGKVVGGDKAPQLKASQNGQFQNLSIMLLETTHHYALSPQQDGTQFEILTRYATRSPFWAALTDSLIDILGKGHTFDDLVNRRVRFVWCDNIPTRRQNPETNEWEEAQGEGWRVYSVDGRVGPWWAGKSLPGMSEGQDSGNESSAPSTDSLEETFLGLADGKEPAEFVEAVIASAELRGTDYYEAVLSNDDGALAPYIESGRVSQVDGRYVVSEFVA